MNDGNVMRNDFWDISYDLGKRSLFLLIDFREFDSKPNFHPSVGAKAQRWEPQNLEGFDDFGVGIDPR
jgi:hypothetical protein